MAPAAQAPTAPEDAQSRQWGHVGLPPDPAPNTTKKQRKIHYTDKVIGKKEINRKKEKRKETNTK